jgi:hypothetical protein
MKYKYEGNDERKLGAEFDVPDNCIIWLARMCVGEGGKKCSRDKASAMMWAMANRYLLHPATPKWIPLAREHGAMSFGVNEFIGMVRMFSQPINPRWARGGDKAEKYKNTKFATEARLRRRDETTRMKACDIPYEILKAVEDFADGMLFPPEILTTMDRPRISNWASLPSTPTSFPHGVDIDGDWFFEDKSLVDGCVIVRY